MKYEWVAANHNSQRVSHSSTAWDADELNYRVRDGYGWNLVAMAAETDYQNRTGILPDHCRQSYHLTLYQRSITRVSVQSSSRPDPLQWVTVHSMSVGLDC